MKYQLNERQKAEVEASHNRWIAERVAGRIDNKNVHHPPITHEEAERIWEERVRERFEWIMFDPEVIQRLGLEDANSPIPAEAIAEYQEVRKSWKPLSQV